MVSDVKAFCQCNCVVIWVTDVEMLCFFCSHPSSIWKTKAVGGWCRFPSPGLVSHVCQTQQREMLIVGNKFVFRKMNWLR